MSSGLWAVVCEGRVLGLFGSRDEAFDVAERITGLVIVGRA